MDVSSNSILPGPIRALAVQIDPDAEGRMGDLAFGFGMDACFLASTRRVATGAFYEQAEAVTYPYQHGVLGIDMNYPSLFFAAQGRSLSAQAPPRAGAADADARGTSRRSRRDR